MQKKRLNIYNHPVEERGGFFVSGLFTRRDLSGMLSKINMKNTTIQTLLLKRFATKSFDTTKKVDEEDLAYILEAARLSCSSLNVQPWHITVVTNPELRAKIQAASYGQSQVVEASHLLILSAVKDEKQHVQANTDAIRAAAGDAAADSYQAMATGTAARLGDQKISWLQRQTYLALQAMILAAADRDIDSCPMEGFDPAAVGELLGNSDIVPTALLPIGYAAAPGRPKQRLALEQITSYIK